MLPSNVLAVGGGHGLATVLRALRRLDVVPTAIVSVADNGGSSGKLLADYGVPAVGDLRRCIEALADEQKLLTKALGERFTKGSLQGHPLGNLLLTSLLQVADLQTAIDEVCRALEVQGRVFPAAQEPVELVASSSLGKLCGQVEIEMQLDAGCHVDSVTTSAEAKASDEVLEAIDGSEVVLIAPGSFYTSTLGALSAPNLVAALTSAAAKTVLIANISTEHGGALTHDPTVQVDCLKQHGVDVDLVLAPSEVATGFESDSVKTVELLQENQLAHSEDLLAQALRQILVDL